MQPIDPDLLKAFALKVWTYKQGELVSLMVHIGNELGLYTALAETGPSTSDELAARSGLDERWVREWLLGQAAAGLVARTPDGVYQLEPEAIEVLVNQSSLAFAAPAFGGGQPPVVIAATKESFRTGRGVTYEDLGEEVASQIDRQSTPWLTDFLVDQVLPEVEGVVAGLETGAMVADIGCGGGVSTETMARRYPNSVFVGYEPSAPAVEAAGKRLAALDNASVERAFGEDLPGQPTFDFVLALDCMHDVPFPDRIAQAVHRSLKPDGTWLIKDMRSSPVFENNLKNPMLALQYGYSLIGCLGSATSVEGGAALGTLGFNPEVAERIARAAGFSMFETISLEDDPVHFYYAIKH